MTTLSIHPVAGIPEINEGDNIAEIVSQRFEMLDDDVVIIASKVVAKAEGRMVACDRDDKAARAALIEANSKRILRRRGDLFITETEGGFVCANAGIDFSNVAPGYALLLPRDADRSAFKVRQKLLALTGTTLGVVVTDTFGRAWRNGVTDIAIGCAGIKPIIDLRGTKDDFGNDLGSTQICVADELAAAAELVMGKSRRIPVVIIRGADPDIFTSENTGVSSEMIRLPDHDLFR